MAKVSPWRPRILGVMAGLAFATPSFGQAAATPTAAQRANDAVTLARTSSTQVQAATPQSTGPTFWVLGIPIRPSAPVPPPYEGTAYNDLGGQPMTSVDQVMSQQFTDQQK